MFTAALFKMGQNKQTKKSLECPIREDWLKKLYILFYIHTIEYLVVIKNNEDIYIYWHRKLTEKSRL